ncbi:hypothetical protein [Humibacter ginsenosidimutans]|uniref:Uncharacterized protein n=1 Tax=Humibacter ginsenosidimutans TaxID=2599293 RepID=A0A5B8M115_9MICO|nr:hypothetical protein [Humibacter ginsenosidimutans]QDZ14013.1 hypothetical protein FPZ11_03750 [Humibacter ginsenosidimutans]
MSNGLGPGSLGPVTMKSGDGSVPGLPPAPARIQGRARWFFIGLTTGIVGTLVVVVTVVSLTR